MPVTLVISGCCGRMGRAIAAAALQDGAASIAAALEEPRHDCLGRDYGTALGRPAPLGVAVTDNAKEAIGRGQVLVEFTSPEATVAHAALARELRRAMVIGTTGLSEAQRASVAAAAKDIAIVLSPNMSLGVTVLFELARQAAQRLSGFDVEIVEAHHRQKKDAPSGTAKRLAEAVAGARGMAPEQVPVHAVRAGDIVGDHTVILAGVAERLELTHRAQSREVFAQGALRAALFAARQRPGLYDMSHVLGAAPDG
jgi:4-hydroxy-tetrahydrodipicolinate reductase